MPPASRASEQTMLDEEHHGTPDDCDRVHKGTDHGEWYANLLQLKRERHLIPK